MTESSWKLKLQRARRHQQDLEVGLREYSQLNPFELVSRLEGNDLVIRVNVKREIPEELSLITGDLLHNTRSALDLLVMAVARKFISESGRQMSYDEEKRLYFPITDTEPEFTRVTKKLEQYLSGPTIERIRIVQPWSMAEAWLKQNNEEISIDALSILIFLDPLRRLHRLNNLDKHRQLLAIDFRPSTITLGDGEFDPIDQDREPDGEPIDLDELDPETRENLMNSILKMQERDERPDSYDCYFSTGEIYDGAEIARYIRHDRGQMPDGLTARGNLRVTLSEPELAKLTAGAPLLQKTVREMIDTVESVCIFVESGAAPPQDYGVFEFSRDLVTA